MDQNMLDKQRALNQILTEVVDTVSTFDGRFSYTPATEDGRCVISFANAGQVFDLTLVGEVSEDNIEVKLKWQRQSTRDEEVSILYSGSGPMNRAILYQYVGAGLADWYGKAVRNDFDL